MDPNANITSEFQLVFEGVNTEDPEQLRNLKLLMISDLDLSIDEVREIFENAPATVRTAPEQADLHVLMNKLSRAGARVLIVQPDSLVNHAEENNEEESFEFEIDLDSVSDEPQSKTREDVPTRVYNLEEFADEDHDTDPEIASLLEGLKNTSIPSGASKKDEEEGRAAIDDADTQSDPQADEWSLDVVESLPVEPLVQQSSSALSEVVEEKEEWDLGVTEQPRSSLTEPATAEIAEDESDDTPTAIHHTREPSTLLTDQISAAMQSLEEVASANEESEAHLTLPLQEQAEEKSKQSPETPPLDIDHIKTEPEREASSPKLARSSHKAKRNVSSTKRILPKWLPIEVMLCIAFGLVILTIGNFALLPSISKKNKIETPGSPPIQRAQTVQAASRAPHNADRKKLESKQMVEGLLLAGVVVINKDTLSSLAISVSSGDTSNSGNDEPKIDKIQCNTFDIKIGSNQEFTATGEAAVLISEGQDQIQTRASVTLIGIYDPIQEEVVGTLEIIRGDAPQNAAQNPSVRKTDDGNYELFFRSPLKATPARGT